MTSSHQPLNEARLDLGDHRILELPLDGEIIPAWMKQPKPSINQLDGVMAAWHTNLLDESLIIARNDGLGEGDSHRYGPNYKPAEYQLEVSGRCDYCYEDGHLVNDCPRLKRGRTNKGKARDRDLHPVTSQTAPSSQLHGALYAPKETLQLAHQSSKPAVVAHDRKGVEKRHAPQETLPFAHHPESSITRTNHHTPQSQAPIPHLDPKTRAGLEEARSFLAHATKGKQKRHKLAKEPTIKKGETSRAPSRVFTRGGFIADPASLATEPYWDTTKKSRSRDSKIESGEGSRGGISIKIESSEGSRVGVSTTIENGKLDSRGESQDTKIQDGKIESREITKSLEHDRGETEVMRTTKSIDLASTKTSRGSTMSNDIHDRLASHISQAREIFLQRIDTIITDLEVFNIFIM